MVALLTVIVAGAFGAADQYLGSLTGHFGHFAWATDVSLISAPWLLLALVAGWAQRDPRRATVLGFVATLAALVGYMAMTLSPIENAHPSLAGITGFVRSDPFVFIGSVVTGPLFGWLGHRWRAARSWQGAFVASLVLCLEPLAHIAVRQPIRSSTAALAEVAGGVALATYFGLVLSRHRSAGRSDPAV
jgi:hypothetical protein